MASGMKSDHFRINVAVICCLFKILDALKQWIGGKKDIKIEQKLIKYLLYRPGTPHIVFAQVDAICIAIYWKMPIC